MSAFLDSSVLVAALAPDEAGHPESLALLTSGGNFIYSHALLETYSTLTGGRLGVKVEADFAARLLSQTILPRVRVIELGIGEMVTALGTARMRGVRGGGVYDYMHLFAAMKVNATVFYTFNLADFQHLQRPGDPEIRLPSSRNLSGT